MKSISAVILLALTVDGANRAIVNSLADFQIAMGNSHLPKQLLLPDFQAEGITAQGVTLAGMSSWLRTGDASISVNDMGGLISEIDLGMSALFLSVGHFQCDNLTAEGVGFAVQKNSFHFKYAAYLAQGCNSTLEDLSLTALDRVTASSKDPKLDGRDFSLLFQERILPALNERLASGEALHIYRKFLDPCLAIH
ncbi:hypothetical protein AAG570_013425 [Ranatra chinensis]|uniref:Uncharacterized protein n=1 Tax=Ranatra chinensis TaxID=642074 RepID=A0ABD0YC59_9HEMI